MTVVLIVFVVVTTAFLAQARCLLPATDKRLVDDVHTLFLMSPGLVLRQEETE